MTIPLDGISLENYRGIGSRQRIGPFGQCNFFIGANNVGKSVVLNFLGQHAEKLNVLGASHPLSASLELTLLDAHLGRTQHQIAVGIGIRHERLADLLLVQSGHSNDPEDKQTSYLKAFLAALSVIPPLMMRTRSRGYAARANF
jgi:hypothetical protein